MLYRIRVRSLRILQDLTFSLGLRRLLLVKVVEINKEKNSLVDICDYTVTAGPRELKFGDEYREYLQRSTFYNRKIRSSPVLQDRC